MNRFFVWGMALLIIVLVAMRVIVARKRRRLHLSHSQTEAWSSKEYKL